MNLLMQVRREKDRVVVHLAGRLTERQVPDLLAACSENGLTTLELDELISADVTGIDALGRIEQDGGQLTGLPEYMRLLLDVRPNDGRKYR